MDRVDLNKAYGTVSRTNPTSEAQLEVNGSIIEVVSSGPHDWNMSTLMKISSVRDLVISSLALSFVSGGFDVLFVLFCYLPISTGGLGYSVCQFLRKEDRPNNLIPFCSQAMEIGYALAIAGFSAALLQLLVMPSLLRHYSVLSAYKSCMKLWPGIYMILPCLNLLARKGLDQDSTPGKEILIPQYSAMLWMGVGICLALSRIANLAFS